jgi:hypothetical protein
LVIAIRDGTSAIGLCLADTIISSDAAAGPNRPATS